jgi:hypothetical protein
MTQVTVKVITMLVVCNLSAANLRSSFAKTRARG